jgi:hypothetical protein
MEWDLHQCGRYLDKLDMIHIVNVGSSCSTVLYELTVLILACLLHFVMRVLKIRRVTYPCVK